VAARTDQNHPLVGAAVQVRGQDGAVHGEAKIISVVPSGSNTVGDLALLQFFEYLSGMQLNRRLVPLTELANERWTFYESVEKMNEQYDTERSSPSASTARQL
jgi:hypothetical protein